MSSRTHESVYGFWRGTFNICTLKHEKDLCVGEENCILFQSYHQQAVQDGQAKCCENPDIAWNNSHTKSVCVFCGTKTPTT